MSTVSALPPEDGAPTERDLDVRYYAGLVWRSRRFVLAAALLGLFLGLVIALVQTPEYRASAMIQIEPPTPTFMTVTDALVGAGNYWQNADFYNTQFKVLRSKGLADKVVDRLKLKDRPPFRDNPEAGSLFLSHVDVEPVPESRLVLVSITHEDPKEAALWANTLADIYIEQTLETRVDSARKAYEWLQGRLSATQSEMKEAQDKLFKSYQTQDLFVPEGSVSAVTSSITKLNEDYIQAQARRIAIEAALKQATEMRAKGLGLDALPQVAADPVVAGYNERIATLTVDLSRMAEKYKEGHPEVQKVQAQIAQFKKTRDDRATQSRKATELEALKKEADSAKNLYEVLLQKIKETDIAASIRSNNVTVVDRAAAPRWPVRPNRRKIGGAGLVFGLVAGLGLVFLRDYMANTFRDPEEVERYLHLDLLAAVPRYELENAHLVTEAYQNLRTSLLFARHEEGGQVVLITGTAPQEGKTTTLVNLAKLLAGSGEKTIVLDCDLRRAQLHHRLELPREPGFTDYFVRHEELEAVIQPTRLPNLYALTAGPLPPNPPAMLARKNLGDLLEHLRGRFEWILVDSPPLASVTDALLLARHADLTVMVVQHLKVDKRLVRRSVAALRRATPNLLGAVLNAVDMQARGYHYYYYQQSEADPGKRANAKTGEKAAPPEVTVES